MCGRFALTLPHDAMAQLFNAVLGASLMPVPRYNICRTQNITVVATKSDGRHLLPMRWGFLPHWYKTDRDGPLLINARAETIAEKPAFRAACRARRCLIPATGFYEWTKTPDGDRLPWYIHPTEARHMAFAGIWQDWTSPEGVSQSTCAMVTISANETMSAVHHRMPVTIIPADYALWLGEAGKGAATLMQPAPEDRFALHRVDARVNSNRPDDPDLIMPFDG
jgi:putative SOS response-associated peptidase YedK